MYVVVRLLPFHRTTDEAVNLLPVTVRVNAGPPATVVAGEIDVAMGAGASDVSTVTGGLVATRVYPLFRKRRNS
jgi:hypothetical protein